MWRLKKEIKKKWEYKKSTGKTVGEKNCKRKN